MPVGPDLPTWPYLPVPLPAVSRFLCPEQHGAVPPVNVAAALSLGFSAASNGVTCDGSWSANQGLNEAVARLFHLGWKMVSLQLTGPTIGEARCRARSCWTKHASFARIRRGSRPADRFCTWCLALTTCSQAQVSGEGGTSYR